PALALLEEAEKLLQKLEEHGRAPAHELRAVDWILDRVQRALKDVQAEVWTQDAARRAYIFADVGFATLRGLIVDDLFARGFDAVDDKEFTEWLRDHGASKETLDSAFMRSTYDTVFGFVAGDPNGESIAAGTALRSGLRMFFGYKGAFMWLMQAGMGDVVFA